jgi:hypothetical protein
MPVEAESPTIICLKAREAGKLVASVNLSPKASKPRNYHYHNPQSKVEDLKTQRDHWCKFWSPRIK